MQFTPMLIKGQLSKASGGKKEYFHELVVGKDILLEQDTKKVLKVKGRTDELDYIKLRTLFIKRHH